MPDHPRQISSIQYGFYDDPPATDSSTPRTRQDRLQRALEHTYDLDPTTVRMMELERASRSGPASSRRRQRSPSSDGEDLRYSTRTSGRRSKRTRLDTDHTIAPRPSIQYGYYGQVEAGKLKLDLVSCDGGEHTDARHPQTFLGAKNVLRHDKSVYCSTRPSSNIVLRHSDDTPFCLEKLHIVGPEHGFTAPVREGLAYIAMTMHDLQKYVGPPPHAQRNSNFNPPPRRGLDGRRRTIHLSPEPISLLDALRDPEINAALGHGDRGDANDQRNQSYDRQFDENSEEFYNHTGFPRPELDPQCDMPPAIPPDDDDRWPSEENQGPVILLSDEETGPEETTPADVVEFRSHRLRLMHRRYEIDAWDRADRYTTVNFTDLDEDPRSDLTPLNRLDSMMARSRVDDSVHPGRQTNISGQNSENVGPNSLTSSTGQSAEQEAFKDPSVTCARFQIKRGKHKVAIKFEPAVSGRFMLLKLWAGSQNVDVQSVIAKGYGGGRYFPSVDLA